ncbi:MAG: PKD domain-containing protein [Thermoplasmata archaeon]
MDEYVGRTTRTTAFVAVIVAFTMLGLPALNLGGDGDGIAANAAADPGNRVLRIGVVGMVGSISTLNPLLYTMAEEMLVIWPCYSTLLTYDVNAQMIGDLARSWTISPDGLIWDFKLYETATFYDKNNPTLEMPVTARDVIFTYGLIQNETKNNLHSYFPTVNGQPIIKKMSYGPTLWDLRIELSTEFAPFVGALTAIPILPEYIWKGKAWNWDNYGSGIAPCIGSGFLYYGLNGLPSTTSVDMFRNPRWFHTEENGWQLHVNKILFSSQTSTSSNWAAFEAGDIDLIEWGTPDQYNWVVKENRIPGAIGQYSSTGFVYEYNLNQMTDELRKELGGTYNKGTNNQLLLDPVVKLAIAMTVDKQAFIDAVYSGLGEPADSLVPKAHPYHYTYGSDPSDEPVVVDRQAARQLLMANGWKYRTDGSEILVGQSDYWTYKPLCKVGGTSPLAFRFWTLSESPEWDTGGRLLLGWAAEAGVDLSIDYDLKTSNEMNGAWMAADYDMWLWDWVFTPLSEISTDILSVCTSMEIGSWSDLFWSNATYDALYNQSLVIMDPDARRLVTDEMQRMIYEDHACQLVAYRADVFLMRTVAPDNWGNWGNWATQWTLDPGQLWPWLYMRIEPGDNHAPVISTAAEFVGQVGVPLSLSASASDDQPLEYRWFFGDGTKSTWSDSPYTTKVYTKDGYYTAYVAAREKTGLDGFMSWTKTTVKVYDMSNTPPHDVDFTFWPADPDSGTIVYLNATGVDDDGDPIYYTWDFGDGGSDAGPSVTHQFRDGVPVTVVLYADDMRLGTGTRPVTASHLIPVTANTPPTVSLPDKTVTVKKSETYTATFYDPDVRDKHRFTWYWGDGGVSVTSVPSATHSYQLKGTYTVTVWCDDLTTLPGHNVSDPATVVVKGANNKPPSITSFTVSKTNPYAGEILTFSCTATDPNNDALNYTFDFGDGTYAYVVLESPGTATVTHAYQVAGFYEAYVSVWDVEAAPVGAGPLEITASWATFSLSLKAGWNLVTVPLLNYGYKASTLGLNTGDTVARWDTVTQKYDKTYIVNVTPPALTDFEIKPNTGYWVYVSSARTLNLLGALPSAEMQTYIQVPTGGGWAIIGLNTLNTTWKASYIPNWYTDYAISTVAAYRNGKYVQYIRGVVPTDFTLVPGEGLFVYCEMSGVLRYTP